MRSIEEGGPLAERYVDGHELARLMGVSYSTIKRWLREDPPVPSESWGMRRRFYRLSEVLEWAHRRADKLVEPVPQALERRDVNARS